MSRLIDADEVKRFYNEEFPTLDNGVHWSRNDIIMNLSNIPTVKAIPIEWIEKFMNRFRLGMVTSDEYALLHFMLTEWEVENEQTN